MQNMAGRPRLLLQNNNALLRKLAAEKGITLIDVATAFESATDKQSYFFKDQYHPNQKGAEFIASTVAEGWQ
jgi:lysophospholipase L1-like esterase